MFTIITSQGKGNKRIIFKPMKLSYVEHNGVKFSLVHLKNSRKVNWCKVRKVLGDTKTRIILGNNISLPQETDVKEVDYTAYSHILTINALNNILDYNKSKIKNKTVTLIDIFCRYQNYADVLVKYFGCVRIITNKIDLYKTYKSVKLYECGATIMLSSVLNNSTSSNNILFVSPDGIVFSTMANQNTPIFSAKSVNVDINAPIYHSFRANTPSEYAIEITNEISQHIYQAALYEHCGLRCFSKNMPIYGYLNNDTIRLEDIKINIFPIDIK